jgi:hypothetical protein
MIPKEDAVINIIEEQSPLTISEEENERARQLTLKKNILDWQSGIVYAKKQGYKEARAEYELIIAENDRQIAQQAARIAELKRKQAEK